MSVTYLPLEAWNKRWKADGPWCAVDCAEAFKISLTLTLFIIPTVQSFDPASPTPKS